MEPETPNDCVFCKIISKEIKADVVYEDAETLAFVDIKPNAAGHLLVLPKAHVRNLFEASEGTLGSMMATTKKVALALKATLRAEGVNLIMNNEPAAGQIVFHAHMHVIPRRSGDGITFTSGKPDYVYGEGESANLASILRTALG